MDFIKELETPDLMLKKAKQEDLESIFNNYWCSEVPAKYMLWTPQKDLQQAQERLNKTLRFQKDHFAFFIYEKSTNQAIGQAGMIEVEPNVYEDIGIGMGEKFVGKGYGKQILRCFINYLFSKANAKKIICSCFEDNIASRKMQQACGLKYEYSKKCTRQRDNLEYTADYYTITREDWIKNSKKDWYDMAKRKIE